MTKLLFFLVIVFAALFVVACSGGEEPSYYSDPAQTINVKSGDEFVLALDSNPTTGYTWEETSDSSMVSLEGIGYQQDDVDDDVVGVGGKEFFTFKALQTGETTIEMVYGQHWDSGEVEAPLVFTVEIQ